jgi:hypothetical protein
MRLERTYFQGLIQTEPVAAVLVKTVENKKTKKNKKTVSTLCTVRACRFAARQAENEMKSEMKRLRESPTDGEIREK